MPGVLDHPYLLLKTATSLYGRGPTELSAGELDRARSLAARQHALEARVLASEEARAVVVPAATVEAALQEIRGRYASEEAFVEDLGRNGLDLAGFTAALARELKVEAVLDKVGSRAPPVSDIDVELYYHYHPKQFIRPERRAARHILVTVNPELADNTRETAYARIQAIAARLAKDPRRFEEQAMKHSECPSALRGGLLGEFTRGQLYPELDAVLFTLEPMRLSAIIETALGFHLLRCDAVKPAGVLRLEEAREGIRRLLSERRRRDCLRTWLQHL